MLRLDLLGAMNQGCVAKEVVVYKAPASIAAEVGKRVVYKAGIAGREWKVSWLRPLLYHSLQVSAPHPVSVFPSLTLFASCLSPPYHQLLSASHPPAPAPPTSPLPFLYPPTITPIGLPAPMFCTPEKKE